MAQEAGDLLMILVVVSCKRSANRRNNKTSAAILWGWWSLPHSHAVALAPPPQPPRDVPFWVKSSWKWKLCGWIPVGVSEETSGTLACWQDSNLIVWPSVLPLQTPIAAWAKFGGRGCAIRSWDPSWPLFLQLVFTVNTPLERIKGSQVPGAQEVIKQSKHN